MDVEHKCKDCGSTREMLTEDRDAPPRCGDCGNEKDKKEDKKDE